MTSDSASPSKSKFGFHWSSIAALLLGLSVFATLPLPWFSGAFLTSVTHAGYWQLCAQLGFSSSQQLLSQSSHLLLILLPGYCALSLLMGGALSLLANLLARKGKVAVNPALGGWTLLFNGLCGLVFGLAFSFFCHSKYSGMTGTTETGFTAFEAVAALAAISGIVSIIASQRTGSHWPLAWRWVVARADLTVATLAMLFALQTLLSQRINDYVLQIIVLAGVNIILAVSLNLINGITGQFSLGHAGFMAIGAYTGGWFTVLASDRLELPMPAIFALSLLVAALCAGIAGWLVGLPSLRLRGDYLAIVTLGFGEIIRVLITTITTVNLPQPKGPLGNVAGAINHQIGGIDIGGARGFINIPLLTSFAWVYGAVILCILMMRNLADSELGRSMRAVREDEVAAEAVGVNTTKVKVRAFVASSMWAGVAGALQAHYIQSAHPGSFTFVKSVEVVVAVVLGGLGSITGVTVTAAGLTGLVELLRNPRGAFWTGVALIVLAAILSFSRYRPAIARNALHLLNWLKWPAASLIGLYLLFRYRGEWIEANISALRYVIYSLILIVLMLLRPQGLLGRSELSWNWLLRRKRVTVAGVGAGAVAEPVDEGIQGELQ